VKKDLLSKDSKEEGKKSVEVAKKEISSKADTGS
jgi:hypothetical protein